MNTGMPGPMNKPSPMMVPNPNAPVSSPMQHGQQPPPVMMQMQQGPVGMPPQQPPPQMMHQNNPQHAPQQPGQPGMPPQVPPPIGLKDMNVAYLCRLGAEFVQEIVSRTLELFQLLRSMTPQASNQQCEEKRNKVKELTKIIDMQFKRLRKIYDRCNEVCSSMDYVDIESLMAIKDDDDCGDDKNAVDDLSNETEATPTVSLPKINEEKKKNNPRLQELEKEYKDMVELNKLKNRQIKEVIDRLRKLVWDINTMLAMRKP